MRKQTLWINRGNEVRTNHHPLETALTEVPSGLLMTSSNNISVSFLLHLFVAMDTFMFSLKSISFPSALSPLPFCLYPHFMVDLVLFFLMRISSSFWWVTVWHYLGEFKTEFFWLFDYQYLHLYWSLSTWTFSTQGKTSFYSYPCLPFWLYSTLSLI